ncbi:hypothetical protein EUX98_g882 [Antrodiella citrinella]|uniref:Ubiquitin 3 binding protein But2 C-terminal domain-containing protein n=1 Tax=Antrodiella citrinella TaxID=2447956 RepID=A0A4V3XJJ5_9APHY|nr:hypothetical protein EUX98_g882 [Antrodiella citrinella]
MGRLHAQHILTGSLGSLFILNLMIWSYFLIGEWRKAEPTSEFTYVGDDYPIYLPVRPAAPVVQVMEETAHYPIYGNEARNNWALSLRNNFSLYTLVGPEHRAFTVAMEHQLHCLRLMRAALNGAYDEQTQGHFTHCLHYIRHMVLCNPNLTLEPADVMERDFEVERTGATHVCRDWRAVYGAMDDGWTTWMDKRYLKIDLTVLLVSLIALYAAGSGIWHILEQKNERLRSPVSPTWDVGKLPQVAMYSEESVRYILNSSDAAVEWALLVPPNGGIVHVDVDGGASPEPFMVSVFHQLRCLDVLRSTYAARDRAGPLARHCMNYIRQTVLCRADTKLEKVISFTGEHRVEPWGPMVCQDWRRIYQAQRDNQRVESKSKASHEGVELKETGGHYETAKEHSQRMPRLYYWAFLGVLTCSALNIVYLVATFQYKSPAWSSLNVDKLEFASSYIAFEEAHKSGRYNVNGSNVPPSMLFPSVLAPINQSEPERYYVGAHRVLSLDGTFYPSDRRLVVSLKESTIAQFYAGDYGMERCTIKMMLPESNSQILPSGSASIQVWRVKAQRKLDIHKLNWKTRPQRESMVASWELHNNQTVESAEFVCPSGSYQTFELACTDNTKDCGIVDLRQETRVKTLGSVGHVLIDSLAERLGVRLSNERHGFIAQRDVLVGENSVKVTLLRTKTFMNISGPPVAAVLRIAGCSPASLLVIHDSLDHRPFVIAPKFGGSANGHNGVRSVIAALGNNSDFHRLRVGIGKNDRNSQDAADYVLSKLSNEERIFLSRRGKGVDLAWTSIEKIIESSSEAR